MSEAHEMYQDALSRAWLDEAEYRALDEEMRDTLLAVAVGAFEIERAVGLYDQIISMRPVPEGKRAILRRRFRAAVEDLVSEVTHDYQT